MPKRSKTKGVPDLEKYIPPDKKRLYCTYREAATHYSLSYYELVRIARAAGAVMKIRKNAIVDLELMDAYIESFREES